MEKNAPNDRNIYAAKFLSHLQWYVFNWHTGKILQFLRCSLPWVVPSCCLTRMVYVISVIYYNFKSRNNF